MDYTYLVDLHRANARQGPGGDAQTQWAIALSGLSGLSGAAECLEMADLGCGTGAAALVLAKALPARITAVDLFPEFLDGLQARAEQQGLADRIRTLAGSMDDLPFADDSLDAIWSEGAIYNIGFRRGVASLRRFLKPGGILAVTEITWLRAHPPEQIATHWHTEYPDIGLASAKIQVLEEQGFVLKGYFPLPESCWLDNYYTPLQNGFDAFLARHASAEARQMVEAEKREIALYRTWRDYYSYGFYIAQKN